MGYSVGSRWFKEPSIARVLLDSATKVAERFSPELLAENDREIMLVVALDPGHHYISHEVVAIGHSQSVGAPPRQILRGAIADGACSIVILHNHPGGEPKPSEQDMQFTVRMVRLCMQIQLPLLDHIVVASNGGWCSIRGLVESNNLPWDGEGAK